MPLIACGLDKQPWNQVQKILEKVMGHSTIDIQVYTAHLMAGSNYFYKFSTAENEKRSQDLLLEFAELPREPDFVHPLQRIFDVLPSTEVAEPFEPFQFIDEVEEEPELWLNIDELKIEDDVEQGNNKLLYHNQ
ncbi:hypothetical protein B566_EDAN016905 [Ephemera danica]|nr:hypothetical protein B566_EDAN016905 [Ephemera danica]